jgi:hypothetical protein
MRLKDIPKLFTEEFKEKMNDCFPCDRYEVGFM